VTGIATQGCAGLTVAAEESSRRASEAAAATSGEVSREHADVIQSWDKVEIGN
jgi:hypothetical protein